MADPISYNMATTKLMSQLTLLDPTPEDLAFSDADIERLGWEERVALYHAFAQLSQSNEWVPERNIACRLFSTPTQSQIAVDLDEQLLTSPRAQEYEQNFTTAIMLMQAVASTGNADYKSLIEKSCWPATPQGDIAMILVDGLESFLRRNGAPVPDLTAKDALSVRIATSSDPAVQKREYSLFIFVDAQKTQGDFYKIFAALVHEYIGHAFLYMTAHPNVTTAPTIAQQGRQSQESSVAEEIAAFKRSVRFLEMAVSFCRTDASFAFAAPKIEKLLEEEKFRLRSYLDAAK
ncbi:MAG TPA: hypothetical protein VJC18_11305 [bacterium]|nr:hypothetical protein [bacterium]